jgi:hypothetical protein
MRGSHTWIFSFVTALAVACGGSNEPAETVEPVSDVSADDVEQTASSDSPSGSSPSSDRLDETEQKPAAKPTSAEPTFKEGGTVEEAVKAVPQGADRVNIEQEALSRPLQDPALYEPCKMGAAHFKMRIAVWDGKAVGIDLTTTPQNPKLADCLKERIRAVTWVDKVKSLNTVEYAF